MLELTFYCNIGGHMSISLLQKMLYSGKKHIKINQNLLHLLDLEQAALYSYLVDEYQKSLRNEDYKYFNGDIYIYCPVDLIEKAIGLSAFRQRNALCALENKNLLKVKLGKSRTRYIWINEDISVLESVMYGYHIASIKADFEKYVEDRVKKLIVKFSSKDERNIDTKYLLEVAKKSDLYNQFSELGIGWLAQIEKVQEKESRKYILK